MAKCLDPDGVAFAKDQLIELHRIMRAQRNAHRDSINQYLRTYITMFLALLTLELALAGIAVRWWLGGGPDAGIVATSAILFALVPIGISIFMQILRERLQVLFRKEYRKLMEHLTVEQKIEHVLGLDGPVRTHGTDSTSAPFNQDASLLPDRWLEGRLTDRKADAFVERVRGARDVFFRPLSSIIDIVFYLGCAIAVVVLVTLLAIMAL
jgi:hypothetical protein